MMGLWDQSGDEWDAIIAYLWRTVRGGELDDDEVAPTATTVGAIERLVPPLRRYRAPDVGLNDDGSVALRWADPTKSRSFALHFGGKRVSAVLSDLEGPGHAVSFSLADAEAVLPLIDGELISKMVTLRSA